MHFIRILLTLLSLVSASLIGPAAYAQTTPGMPPKGAPSETISMPPQPPNTSIPGNPTSIQPLSPSNLPGSALPTFDKTKVQQIMSDRNMTVVQKFDSLRDERRKVTAALDTIDNRLKDPALYEASPLQTSDQNVSINDKAIIESWLANWKTKLANLQEDMKDRTTKAESLGTAIREASQWVAYDTYLISNYDLLSDRWKHNKRQIEMLKSAQSDHYDYLTNLDDAISNLMNQDRTNDDFRREVTLIFASLVGVVIIEFFRDFVR